VAVEKFQNKDKDLLVHQFFQHVLKMGTCYSFERRATQVSAIKHLPYGLLKHTLSNRVPAGKSV
jgi:hypothetical protein